MGKINLEVIVYISTVAAFVWFRFTSLDLSQSIYYSYGLGLSVWFVYCTYIYPLYFSPLRHIPTVPGNPVLGHGYIRLMSELGVPERQWHNKYGNVLRFYLIFGIERLSIADHDAIKDVTLRNPYMFRKPFRAVRWMRDILGPRGILLVEGSLHVRQRKSIAPAFSTSSIRALEPKFWEKGLLLGQLLGDEVRRSANSSTPIHIQGWLNRATLDVIGTTAFNYDVDSLQNPDAPLAKAYSSVFAFDLASCIIQGLRLYFGFAKHLPFQMNRSMRDGSKLVSNTATDIVHGKLETKGSPTSSKDIISLVVKHNQTLKAEDPDRLTFGDIRDQVMTFLGAGHDTTATGVAWTIDLLSKHPQIQQRLREEILNAFPDLCKASSADDAEIFASTGLLDTLPYLQKVCAESLRFIPPIPTTIREPAVDTVLAGYAIPAGTNIYMTSNAVNHLRCYWGDDADVFDPDRWDCLPEGWPSNAFLTFLEGPRGCIGRKFAETEMKVFVCCLIARFTFERDEEWPDQEQRKMWRLVLRPKDGIRVRLGLLDV